MASRILQILFMAICLMAPAWAVEPDEILDNPVLEARAREISQGLRCLVCRNESIDESNADLAKDLRLLVRERLVNGDSDAEVVAFIVARYGDYVLLRPPVQPNTWLLWLAPGLLLIAGGASVIAFLVRSRRQSRAAPPDLTDEERRKVQDLMGEQN